MNYNKFYRRRRMLDHLQVCVYILVIFVILIIMGISITGMFNTNTYTATVTEKERVTNSGNSKYLIFTEDTNGNVRVFENTDIWHKFKFNSSDIYAQIKVGETYTFHVIGYRIPWLSMYENIVSIE